MTLVWPLRPIGDRTPGHLLLDTTYNVATPEGVELKLPIAGLAPRALAWLVDALIKMIAVSVASFTLAILDASGTALYLLIVFVALWFYNVLFEVFNHGATPGKRALNLRVMNIEGTPVGWSGSLTRNLIRAVDALPGCYAFGCISVLLSRNFQRLGDLAAGTIVVHDTRKTRPMASADVVAVPLQVPVSLEEQQAIVSFGERATRLSHDRANELARTLEPVVGDVDAIKLSGYANWLAGGGRTP